MTTISQETAYNLFMDTVGAAAKLPVVKVKREAFLREQFKDSPYLNHILSNGPQTVYTTESLLKRADKVINTNTKQTATISLVSGLPSNPFTAIPLGAADVTQYFGYALHLAQQIAYLFGEDELFNSEKNKLTEEEKLRITIYLGIMFGASGASTLLLKTSKQLGPVLAKKIAAKTVTHTTWHPLMKKVAAVLGIKITKQTVNKAIIKGIPLMGGVISGGITYATFRPLGKKLAQTLAAKVDGTLETASDVSLRPEFKAMRRKDKADDEFILEGEFQEIEGQD